MRLAEKQSRRNWRKLGFVFWCAVLILVMLAHWYPIRDGMTRSVLVGGPLLLWLGGLWLAWPIKIARYATASLSGLVVLFLISQARPVDAPALRGDYVRALRSYTGTPYVWGGETGRGIDCSGLMRAGLIDANLQAGLRTLNPAPIRSAFSLWWHDTSAKAMKQGYGGQTQRLYASLAINNIDTQTILPGDMAVTMNGVHVLAYIGNHTWIEADPSNLVGNRVIQVRTPSQNPWFKTPVYLVRWSELAGSSG